jgi:hypothetical protein
MNRKLPEDTASSRLLNGAAPVACLLAATLTVAAACGEDGLTGSSPDEVAQGTWGGEHIALTVTPSGATIEFDCARGTIDEPMKVDNRRRFQVRGTFVLGEGGPATIGRKPESRPARYSGSVNARKMALNVRLTDRDESVGDFNLVFGQSPRLYRCL